MVFTMKNKDVEKKKHRGVKSPKKYNYTTKPGAPTKYKPEFCEQLIACFDIKPWTVVNGKRQYQRMPSFVRFADSINVCYRTIYSWADKESSVFHKDFLQAYNKAIQLRKEWLIDVGLSGLSPANSFKFVATNLTDMQDKSETKHGVTDALADLMKEISSDGTGLQIKE